MNRLVGCASAVMLGGATLMLAGCAFRPTILSANSYRLDGEEVVNVTLKSRDAEVIKSRQMYFSIVALECVGEPNRFPMIRPTVRGERVSKFNFLTEGEEIEFSGSMPSNLFDQYREPCVFLEGGSYLGQVLESNTVPIVDDSEAREARE